MFFYGLVLRFPCEVGLTKKEHRSMPKKAVDFWRKPVDIFRKVPLFSLTSSDVSSTKGKVFSNQTIVREEKSEGKRERPEKEKNSAASGLKKVLFEPIVHCIGSFARVFYRRVWDFGGVFGQSGGKG